MKVVMALHAMCLMSLSQPGIHAIGCEGGSCNASDAAVLLSVSRAGTRQLSRKHASGKNRFCSWADSDRYWPNYGGCCPSLVECVEKRPRSNSVYCEPWHPENEKTCWSHVVMCRKSCGKPSDDAAETTAGFQSDAWTKWTFHQNCEYVTDHPELNSWFVQRNSSEADVNYSQKLAFTSGADLFYTKNAFNLVLTPVDSAPAAGDAPKLYYIFVNLGVHTDSVPEDKYQLKCASADEIPGGTWIRNAARFKNYIWLDKDKRAKALIKVAQLQTACHGFLERAIAEGVWHQYFQGAKKDEQVKAAWDMLLSLAVLPLGLVSGGLGGAIGAGLAKILSSPKFMNAMQDIGLVGEVIVKKVTTLATDKDAQSALGKLITDKAQLKLKERLNPVVSNSYAEQKVGGAEEIGRVLLQTMTMSDLAYYDLLTEDTNFQILAAIGRYQECNVDTQRTVIEEYGGNKKMRDGFRIEQLSNGIMVYHGICFIDGHWNYAKVQKDHSRWWQWWQPTTWGIYWNTRIQDEYVNAAKDAAKVKLDFLDIHGFTCYSGLRRCYWGCD